LQSQNNWKGPSGENKEYLFQLAVALREMGKEFFADFFDLQRS
jgi:cation transport regulator ChaC